MARQRPRNRWCTIYRVPGNVGTNWRALMSRGERYEKLGRARVPRKLRGPRAGDFPLEIVDQRCKMTPLHLFWGDLLVWGDLMLMLHERSHGFVYVSDLFNGSTLSLRERLDRFCEMLAAEDTTDGRYDPDEEALVVALDRANQTREAFAFFGISEPV